MKSNTLEKLDETEREKIHSNSIFTTDLVSAEARNSVLTVYNHGNGSKDLS